MSPRTRPGFKLVELLLVIAILAIIAGLVLPAVLKVREAQARTQTNNNLRQCAVAIHNYHGVYNKFPSAAWPGGIYDQADTPRAMWFHLLPYVEQEAAYKNNVHDAIVAAYDAPMAPRFGSMAGKVGFAGNIRLFGYGSLTAAFANSAVDPKGNPSGFDIRQCLTARMQSNLTLARIPDGTSNVLMLATRYPDCGTPFTSTFYSAGPRGTILADGGRVPSTGLPTGYARGGFFGAGSHYTPPGNDAVTAMFQTRPQFDTECIADDSIFGHAMGPTLSTALADASIKAIDPAMSATIFTRALCPSDGNPIGNDYCGCD
jgi:prepilin-type N-terminal cleavage/methylation domain-containing protein